MRDLATGVAAKTAIRRRTGWPIALIHALPRVGPGVAPPSAVPVELLSAITDVKTIAVGRRIREMKRLRRVYGAGRWRKRKGVAKVRLPDGTVCLAEVHWYEAHGVGRREYKIKRILGDG